MKSELLIKSMKRLLGATLEYYCYFHSKKRIEATPSEYYMIESEVKKFVEKIESLN